MSVVRATNYLWDDERNIIKPTRNVKVATDECGYNTWRQVELLCHIFSWRAGKQPQLQGPASALSRTAKLQCSRRYWVSIKRANTFLITLGTAKAFQ